LKLASRITIDAIKIAGKAYLNPDPSAPFTVVNIIPAERHQKNDRDRKSKFLAQIIRIVVKTIMRKTP
jgi:hypothetical protein